MNLEKEIKKASKILKDNHIITHELDAEIIISNITIRCFLIAMSSYC